MWCKLWLILSFEAESCAGHCHIQMGQPLRDMATHTHTALVNTSYHVRQPAFLSAVHSTEFHEGLSIKWEFMLWNMIYFHVRTQGVLNWQWVSCRHRGSQADAHGSSCWHCIAEEQAGGGGSRCLLPSPGPRIASISYRFTIQLDWFVRRFMIQNMFFLHGAVLSAEQASR